MSEARDRRWPGRSRCATVAALLPLAVLLALTFAPQSGYAAARPFAMTALVTFADTTTPDATGTPDATPTPVSTTHTIGYSVRGRKITLERFGTGKRRILISAGIHGDEYGGPVASKFAAYLRAHPSAIPAGAQIDIVAYANPDGRALKRRANARGVDLNRNFPAGNWTRKHARGTLSHGKSAGSEPETKALVRLLKTRRYVRVIALHSRGGLIAPNGKGSLALGKRIAKAAHIRVGRLGKRPGSMGSYVPEKLRTPLFTWELSSRSLTKNVRAGLLVGIR